MGLGGWVSWEGGRGGRAPCRRGKASWGWAASKGTGTGKAPLDNTALFNFRIFKEKEGTREDTSCDRVTLPRAPC